MKKILLAVFLFLISIPSIPQINLGLPDDKGAVEFLCDNITLKEYEIDHNGYPIYWFAELPDHFMISVSIEKSLAAGNAIVCRKYYSDNYLNSSPFKISEINYSGNDEKAVIEYIVKEFQNRQVNQKNVNIYFVYKNYWINIHISKILYTEKDKELFDKISNSARLINDYQYNPVNDLFYGTFLFNSKSYNKASIVYQKALNLYIKNGRTGLNKDLWRALVDQLGMSYGISGNLKDSKKILEQGLKEDPEYPMFHYNLACVYAEEDNKAKCFESLENAVKFKSNMIEGEKFPDPKTDTSFKKYLKDDRFRQILSNLK